MKEINGTHILNYMDIYSEYYVNIKSKNKSFELIDKIMFSLMITFDNKEKTCYTLYNNTSKISELSDFIQNIKSGNNSLMKYSDQVTFLFENNIFSFVGINIKTNIIDLDKVIECLETIVEKNELYKNTWKVYNELKTRNKNISLTFSPHESLTTKVNNLL